MSKILASKGFIARHWQLCIFFLCICSKTYSIGHNVYLNRMHFEFHGGLFHINQGIQQHINTRCWVGNEYFFKKSNNINPFAGIGYFLNFKEISHSIGLNTFYFPQKQMSGIIAQENLYTNLSYRFSMNNSPFYIESKSHFPIPLYHSSLILRLGAGINFMKVDKYHEYSLDNDRTIPDNVFSKNLNTNFTVTAGGAIKFASFPVECGYRFLYLGQGKLKKNSNNIFNTISTGNVYVNATSCTLYI